MTNKQRLVTTENGQFEPIIYEGNKAGFGAFGDLVLVAPDLAAKTVGKMSKILLTDTAQKNQSQAATSGTIIALGDDAFVWNATGTRPFAGIRPKPGTRVLFQRYAGQVYRGADGVDYRLLSEREIGGWIIEDQDEKEQS